MATAVKQISKERTGTKQAVIQSTTHRDIISVGNVVFEKTLTKEKEKFQEHLLEHERKLIVQLTAEHHEKILKLEKQHQKEIEKLKIKHTNDQNALLKEEASRVCDYMNKVHDQRMEEHALEGQLKLKAALVKAREDFDVAKEKTIADVIKKQQQLTAETLRKKELEHEKSVEKLNMEWEQKMKVEEEKQAINAEEMFCKHEEELKKKFNAELKAALEEAEDLHKVEVQAVETKLLEEKQYCASLQQEIVKLDAKLTGANETLKSVLISFQNFVDNTPGFNEGQSEFVLQNLLPPGITEFL